MLASAKATCTVVVRAISYGSDPFDRIPRFARTVQVARAVLLDENPDENISLGAGRCYRGKFAFCRYGLCPFAIEPLLNHSQRGEIGRGRRPRPKHPHLCEKKMSARGTPEADGLSSVHLAPLLSHASLPWPSRPSQPPRAPRPPLAPACPPDQTEGPCCPGGCPEGA